MPNSNHSAQVGVFGAIRTRYPVHQEGVIDRFGPITTVARLFRNEDILFQVSEHVYSSSKITIEIVFPSYTPGMTSVKLFP